MSHAGTALINPRIVFKHAHLQPHMHVADMGCGRTGHVVFPAARLLQDDGIVYAVDIMKSALGSLHSRAQALHLDSVKPVWGDIEKEYGVAIPEGTLDIAFFVNVLNSIRSVEQALSEATRLLKDKGRIVVVDWVRNVGRLGPHDSPLDFGLVASWAMNNGFLVQTRGSLSDYHAIMVLYRHG